jgi:DNA-binding transcriptional LysR family regulator
LQATHPNLQLELIPEALAFRPSDPGVDIAISIDRPRRGRVVISKLADFSLGLYASEEYLKKHGPIGSVADLERHTFVWFIDDLVDTPEIVHLDEVVSNARVVFRSSSIVAQQNAVASGLGLGLLHTFVARMDSRMVSVLPAEIHWVQTYWTIHPTDRRTPRVRAVLAFLNEVVRLHRPQGELAWTAPPVEIPPPNSTRDVEAPRR